MHFSKFLQGFVIRKKCEVPTSKVGMEMFHAPDCGLHFNKKGGVILFMFL